MSRRAVPVIGGIALAGAGYYFYKAGGDPKVAKATAERQLQFPTFAIATY